MNWSARLQSPARLYITIHRPLEWVALTPSKAANGIRLSPFHDLTFTIKKKLRVLQHFNVIVGQEKLKKIKQNKIVSKATNCFHTNWERNLHSILLLLNGLLIRGASSIHEMTL